MKDELDTQIASLKAQLAVLTAKMKTRDRTQSFAELYGLLRGESDTSEDEIAKVRYPLPKGMLD
jgi:hypothetical protein